MNTEPLNMSVLPTSMIDVSAAVADETIGVHAADLMDLVIEEIPHDQPDDDWSILCQTTCSCYSGCSDSSACFGSGFNCSCSSCGCAACYGCASCFC
jgi:hypothetical protein